MEDDKEKLVDEILRLRNENEKLRLEVEDLKKKADVKSQTIAQKKPNFIQASTRLGLPPQRWGQKPGHAGVTRPKPIHIDRELSQTLSACPDCHNALGQPVETTEPIQEDIVPARVEVTRFLHHRWWWKTSPPPTRSTARASTNLSSLPQRAHETQHGVSFEQAALAFYDPHALFWADREHSIGLEEGEICSGLTEEGVLVVVFVERSHNAVFRIISARKATRQENNYYYET